MVDKDLLSIQEARSLVRAARAAQAEYSQLGQERIDAVIKAISEVGIAHAEELAQMAHEETGYGKTADKKKKLFNANLVCGFYSYYGKPPKENDEKRR